MQSSIMTLFCRCLIVAATIPLLFTGCTTGLFGGESKALHSAPPLPSPPQVLEKIPPQDLPVPSPEQRVPVSPPAPVKPAEKAQSGAADQTRRLAAGSRPDFFYQDAVLTEDVTWRGEVRVAGVVTIAPQATLTVEQGTVVRFGGEGEMAGHDAFLLVCGRVVALGTREKPILFSSRFAQPMAGDWQGIAMLGSEKKNLLENCRVEGAETGLDTSYSTVTLKDVHFSRCGTGASWRDSVVSAAGGGANGCITGLHLMDSEVDMSAAVISGNRQGVVADRSSLYLSGGSVSRNDLDALKAADSRIRIAGGSFTANGTGLTLVSSQGTVTGARIAGNAGHGIMLANSRVKVHGNEIAGNGGAGIIVEDGRGSAWGNSIVANGEYDLVNKGTEEFRAMGNWWGAADLSVIGKRIYDRKVESGRGRVFYLPALAAKPAAIP
jgi:hypothetical protein